MTPKWHFCQKQKYLCTCKFRTVSSNEVPSNNKILFIFLPHENQHAPWEFFLTHCASATASRAKGQDPYSICHFEEECLKKIWPKQKISMQLCIKRSYQNLALEWTVSETKTLRFGEYRPNFVSLYSQRDWLINYQINIRSF